MDDQDPQIRRARNQRRTLLELLNALPPILVPGTNFIRALNQLFRANKRFGSRDRKRYRALIFAYLRFQPWLEPLKDDPERLIDHLILLAGDAPDIAGLRKTLKTVAADDGYQSIAKTDADLPALLPSWFQSHPSKALDSEDYRSLFSRPPLWIRAQNQSPEAIVNQLFSEVNKESSPLKIHGSIPGAIRCPADYPATGTQLFQTGAFEIQDISSQILLHLIPTDWKGHWLDACAGAGGKTLQLAKLLGSNGAVTAHDTRASALDELAKRAKRARLKNLSITREPPVEARFEGVFVDAPCSGTGTWRRHPYLMRQTAEADIESAVHTQRSLLVANSQLVKPGGLLVYATCSLSRLENEDVARHFLEENSAFQHEPLASRFGLEETDLGITVLPKQFDGDGLYIVAFRHA